MENKKTINTILCIVFMIALILEITLICLTNLAKNTILSKKYIESTFEKEGFYSQIKNDIGETFKNYVLQANLDYETVDNLIEDEKIREDVGKVIDKVYIGTNINIETDSIKQELTNRINDKILTNSNITVTKESQKSIDDFINVIIENYKNNIEISEPITNQIGNIVININKLINTYIIIMYVITIATFVAIGIMNFVKSKQKKDFINKYQAIAIISSGFIMLLIDLYIKLNIDIENIRIYNKAITNQIIFIMKNIETTMLTYGILLVSIGIIISLVINITQNKEKKG